MPNQETRPLLSLILCSRNDNYSGNSLWRLQTTLNYLAQQVHALDRQNTIEVIVSDWGSEISLRKELQLTPQATEITRFLEIPPSLAEEKQEDSPFAEVIANNAAVRRASGNYIGRIDQDTLVGKNFFKRFFEIAEGIQGNSYPLDKSFLFIGRRSIPLSFSSRTPSLKQVTAYLDKFHKFLPKDGRCRNPWFDAPVGIVVMHRNLWYECKGYDERMLYWGFMEVDLGYRIGLKYTVLNLENYIGCDFFHLSHFKNRMKISDRRKNPRLKKNKFSPNDEDWGLSRYQLELKSGKTNGRLLAANDLTKKESIRSEKNQNFLLMLLSFLGEWFWELVFRVGRIIFRLIGIHPSRVFSGKESD